MGQYLFGLQRPPLRNRKKLSPVCGWGADLGPFYANPSLHQ